MAKIEIHITLDDQTGKMAVFAPTQTANDRSNTSIILAQAIQIVLNLKDRPKIITPAPLGVVPVPGSGMPS